MKKYGFWRTDKPKEAGFSHELISCDFEKIKHKTSMDKLECLPEPGMDTLLKAFEANVKRIPDREFLGTREGDHYEWISWKQAQRAAFNLSAGICKLDLCPITQQEGKPWRFMGIQSKNRKEWNIAHLANMYMNTTTIAMYDTLGPDTIRFVVNQTELTSVTCSNEFVEKFAQLVLEEANTEIKTMHRLKNIVSFEKVLDKDVLEKVKAAGLNLYSLDEVMAIGIDLINSPESYRQ